MSENELEFVDVGMNLLKERLNKQIGHTLDVRENLEHKNSSIETKCGDIFHSKYGVFLFCCFYCCEKFTEIEDFTGHMEKNHLKALIINDKDETERNELFIGQDGIQKSQPSFEKDVSEDTTHKRGSELLKDTKTGQNPTDFVSENVYFNNSKTTHDFSERTINLGEEKSELKSKNYDENLILESQQIKKVKQSSSKIKEQSGQNYVMGKDVAKEEVQYNLQEQNLISKSKKRYRCRICPIRFSLRSKLKQHASIHSGELPGITAPRSPLRLRHQQGVSEHFRKVHTDFDAKTADATNESNENIEKTEQTEATFEINTIKNAETNEQEIDNKNSTMRYKCAHCPKTFRVKYLLTRHSSVHTGHRPFSCQHCPLTFRLKEGILRHLRRIHEDFTGSTKDSILRFQMMKSKKKPSDKPEVEKPFKCQMCHKRFTKAYALKEHERLHTGEKPCKCDHCPKSFHQRNSLYRHLRDVHGILKKTKGVETRMRNSLSLNCRFCDELFSTVELKITHEDSHSVDNRYQCNICLNRFKSKNYLDQHKLIHTGERPFQCSECPKAFAQKANLTVHQKRLHFNQKVFQCDHCEKRFVTTTERKSHMRVHLNEKPFQCEECGKNFTTSGALTSHKLRHTQTKRHSCEVCQKSFYNSVLLRNHVAVHTKEKLFQCTICSSKFSSTSSLRAHMKLHSDKKDYICSICDKAFAQYAGLYSHMKSHGVVSANKQAEKVD